MPPPLPPSSDPWIAPEEPRFTVGSIVGRTFSVWKQNFGVFAAVSLLLQAPMLINALFADPRPRRELSGGQVVMTFVGYFLTLVLTGALTFGVLQAFAGKSVEFGGMLRTGFGKSWRIFVVSFGVGIFTILGALALFVGAFVVMCALWVAVPAAVAEPDSAESALKRSRDLTKGHRLTIFLTLLIFMLLTMSVAMVLGFVGASALRDGTAMPKVFMVGAQVFSLVLGGLGATAPAVAYHDLRVLKEGASTAELAAVFE
jgi:hypothetical protein